MVQLRAPQSHLFGGLAVQEEKVLFAEVVQEQIRLVRPGRALLINLHKATAVANRL